VLPIQSLNARNLHPNGLGLANRRKHHHKFFLRLLNAQTNWKRVTLALNGDCADCCQRSPKVIEKVSPKLKLKIRKQGEFKGANYFPN
jgi:hypothetical protein